MTLTLSILGWILFSLLVLTGLALDLIGLFGNWILLASLGGVWVLTGFEHFGTGSLAAMTVLAVAGEILEFLFAGFGAKKFGGSKGSMLAALVGCLGGAVLGTPFFPLVGTLIGACLGAFVAAALYEHLQQDKAVRDALWTGFGAALGKVGGLFAKLFCGLGILLLAALTY